jgi:tRNA uridine 5-carboxymethylaminomethyl modification enzyme
MGFGDLEAIDPGLAALAVDREAADQVEIEVKYEAYIERQRAQVEKFQRLEGRPLPEDFDYASVRGIRAESREKLAAVRPRSLGQASRIPGVTPADLSVLLVYLDANGRKRRDPS